jgi:S-adenosylmethionine hydrolase
VIALFTDFGTGGPYLGQLRAVLTERAPATVVIDLMNDAPAFTPRAAAYLLDAVRRPFPPGTVFVCVVDPGVGTATREPVVLRADGAWFVGPGNGLLNRVAASDPHRRAWRIEPVPADVSSSFHGRDVFAPAAALIATGGGPPGREVPDLPGFSCWPRDLNEVVYVDGFGNAWTGIRADALPGHARLRCGDALIERAATFGDVPPGTAMWYANSSGLAELAVNRASAMESLGLRVGMPVEVQA